MYFGIFNIWSVLKYTYVLKVLQVVVVLANALKSTGNFKRILFVCFFNLRYENLSWTIVDQLKEKSKVSQLNLSTWSSSV